ncbi:hypothetical protein SERLA73DRAFT_190211 [Serpula lacrymans var. lacrymans S7.3]|uniref:Uncharacterized protein n=2 Tax=Serpula lacrymans var. lacrymans TaxID=341189 RepID=F8QF96_SERL3|nr:uncharacterized protein SERLADRAFT_462103 [Serpula lacrymans var. lacrymans S7.9]EGN93055.1 hypothetical protein SERLA73DRAFT_190211 [Serpula lacrymans var. lacrymans S7.3]EGO27893.1 hypothetical protein SERLADRAFT_462103 [Serpula lacrymans var. lacrymans S7.9]
MLIETLAVTPPLHSVPFPTGSVRSASPAPEDALRPSSRSSRLDLNNGRSRNYSDASFGSKALLNNTDNEEESNPFAVRPPSPDRASRFDPKARGRTMSNATMGTMASKNMLAEENAFAVRPPSPSRSSRFDPKARGRTMSIASMGTRMMLENDYDGEESFRQQGGRDRPYSTLELLRPKVLVMPSPLQAVSVAAPKPPSPQTREGFLVSSEGRPMPPGARTMRRASMTLSAYEPPSAPIASNSFTPNPRSSLSLSQLAFRNTLVVGGQRDIAYTDIDNALPRATEEGEQAQFFEPPPIVIEKAESLAPASMLLPPAPPPTEAELLARPAGKLYGRSLIDNLEARKANMRQKQRVFTGDDRPSMMARGQIRRSSTLIDPASLQRPVSTNLEANLARRNSANAKPLLEFNDKEGRPTTLLGMPGDPKMSKSRSVFGVDTVWEQEMVRLREIEKQEKLDEEARRKREYEEAEKSKKRKGKSKGKKKAPEPEPSPEPEQEAEPDTVEARVSADPPTLPAIQKPVLRRAPLPVGDYDDDESESDVSDAAEAGRNTGGRSRSETAADRWVAESSDEDDNKPRRTPGVGLRFPNSQAPMAGVGSHNNDEDSEEDLPLAAAVERVAKRATMLPLHRQPSDDEDEDKPLSMVLSKAKLNINFDAEDEDDKPLGLRASRVPFESQTSLPLAGDDDDDKPLAFHPEHQRRTQYQMLAQAQQQQMMLQAQFTNSMFFGNPAMMGSGFFAPPMAPPPMMMAPPAPMPSPPPENAKFGLVDRWRRDVAVEGTETG